MVTSASVLPWKVAKGMVLKLPVISGQSQAGDDNKTLCVFVNKDNISSVAFVTQTYTSAIDKIHLEQAYFWTRTWQEGEKEADEDIKHGRMGKPGSAKDIIQCLRSKRK